MKPIRLEEYVAKHLAVNPDEKESDLSRRLKSAVERKRAGARCNVCGQPIWGIGSATVGWDGCFTCITGEWDDSDDYEIDTVC